MKLYQTLYFKYHQGQHFKTFLHSYFFFFFFLSYLNIKLQNKKLTHGQNEIYNENVDLKSNDSFTILATSRKNKQNL